MKKDEIEKLIQKAEERYHQAEMNYQDTGSNRYYTTMCKNEALADILRDALNAEKHIEISKRLSSYVKQWAGIIADFPYKSQQLKEEELQQIISEIMIQAIFL